MHNRSLCTKNKLRAISKCSTKICENMHLSWQTYYVLNFKLKVSKVLKKMKNFIENTSFARKTE